MFTRTFSAFLLLLASATLAVDDYQLGPLSQVKDGVPQGKVISMPDHESKIYAGTKRDWWIYVPAQYQVDKPANLMVFQDGHDYVGVKGAWRVPVVFDNLIASGDMAPTIAIFINPGHSGESEPASAWKNNNRGKEYNTLGDTYARFLLDLCFHCCLGAAGSLSQGLLHHRQLCRSRGWTRLSIPHPPHGAQTSARLSSGW
jgi:enterochelin esterase family protein